MEHFIYTIWNANMNCDLDVNGSYSSHAIEFTFGLILRENA